MTIIIPKYFTLKHIEGFLTDCSEYLTKKDTQESDFILDASKVKEICLLGQLLLYKFMSYTAENHVFREPIIKNLNKPILEVSLKRNGFWELIDTYLKKPDDKKAIVKSYNNLKMITENDFFIAPQKLLRNESYDKKKMESYYLDKVVKFYQNTPKSHTIGFCIAELFSNFWSHATQDSGTVMVAKGNKYYIEICFADTGEGIINSFKNSDKSYKKMNNRELMMLALKKNVTSKPNSNHLGMGLYMINCIVSKNNQSIFKIFSDTEEYIYDDKNKGIYKSISYWRGTITYLRLNLESLLSLDKIEELKTLTFNKIQWS